VCICSQLINCSSEILLSATPKKPLYKGLIVVSKFKFLFGGGGLIRPNPHHEKAFEVSSY